MVLFIVAPLAITAYGLDLPLAIAGVIGTAAALWVTGGFAGRRMPDAST